MIIETGTKLWIIQYTNGYEPAKILEMKYHIKNTPGFEETMIKEISNQSEACFHALISNNFKDTRQR